MIKRFTNDGRNPLILLQEIHLPTTDCSDQSDVEDARRLGAFYSSATASITYCEGYFSRSEFEKAFIRAHERFHALHHLYEVNGKIWGDFKGCSTFDIELLAQLCTVRYLQTLNNHDQTTFLPSYARPQDGWEDIFYSLFRHLPREYNSWPLFMFFTDDQIFELYLAIRDNDTTNGLFAYKRRVQDAVSAIDANTLATLSLTRPSWNGYPDKSFLTMSSDDLMNWAQQQAHELRGPKMASEIGL